MRRFASLAILVAAAVMPVAAEMYRGIGPLDSLADVKARFPGAKFEKLTPAWAQEHDILYAISGEGMSGTIVVKFYDGRPSWRREAEQAEDADQKAFAEAQANEPDDSVTVAWVRWVPTEAIPLQRFVAKYGAPEEEGFSDESLQPYRTWIKRGLLAYLSDDEKLVVRVDYEFTNAELCRAWREKYNLIPEFMKETCAPKASASPKKKPASKQR